MNEGIGYIDEITPCMIVVVVRYFGKSEQAEYEYVSKYILISHNHNLIP